MDAIDKKILSLLGQNARIPLKKIAEQVFLSPPAVSARIERMESSGIITGYRVTVAQEKLGYHITAFVNVVLPPERQEAVILDYLAREGFAYRQDIAQLLGIDPGQCRPILQKMVAAGKILQERQRYLPQQAVVRKNP